MYIGCIIHYIKPDFEQKATEGIELIRNTIKEHPEHKVYVLNSTGKDSMVAQHLCDLSGCDIQTVFNNTTLDCADTYKIVNQNKDKWIILNPKEGFYQYIKRMNFIPTRFSRGCCSIFKEGETIKHFNDVEKLIFIHGVRNEESVGRKSRKDIEKNPKWGSRDWIGLLPIRKWTEFEVWCYTILNNLPVNTKYKKGYKRVGCSVACPFYTKTTWYLDKYWYPKKYERFHKILDEDFLRSSKWPVLNCTKAEYHKCWNGGVYRENPTEEVIQEFMQYKGITDRSLAEKYFNKSCCKCGKQIKTMNTMAMNLKIHGRQINKFLCKSCLMKDMGINQKQWNEYVEKFKQQGCALF